MRRTPRDWLADISLFLCAAGFSVLTFDSVVPEGLSPAVLFVDQLTGALACAALFLRRRWPVQLTVVLLVAGTMSHFVTGAVLVALFTVATCRPPRTTAWVAVLAFAPFPVFLAQGPELDRPATASAITYFALVAATIGWGLYVRSRRELVRSLRERAERAGEEARRQAREDIAREMHDVLAHRLSLLSVHAGALEFNPGAPEAEVRRAAGVIRDSAHQALEDMREIIGVLRGDSDGGRPQPVLADLERLADESRAAGARVTLHQRVARPEDAPALTGRTAYRIAQEGLTNARKHAPDAEVTLTVSGAPDDGLTVEVRNVAASAPPAVPDDGAAVPGGGQGLIGLAERTRLVGGELEHGRTGADFRLRAWLPWRA
ncbi:two-component sensor histidine kinase [Streptomyces armeniacus]|uniref:histidine kinase n=1 Tax=Streptomyces armeniacus TaxID=83291 RepID=A0A345XJW6_9ACTN|nr:histidine kinase [Streptomyces armeniacus]AXK31932.1 two-component sensor histidine kinase [Streptomyces armeniacus]